MMNNKSIEAFRTSFIVFLISFLLPFGLLSGCGVGVFVMKKIIGKINIFQSSTTQNDILKHGDDLVIESLRVILDKSDNFIVKGLLKNKGSNHWKSVRVNVNIFDKDNKLIETDEKFIGIVKRNNQLGFKEKIPNAGDNEISRKNYSPEKLKVEATIVRGSIFVD